MENGGGGASSLTMEQRMAASPRVPIDLSNLSKDPAVLKAQLRQIEEDVETLSRPPVSTAGDTKDREMAEQGMTRAERTQELSLREELARTSTELERLSNDSIAEELRTRGVPPTMEAYETKYKEAKAQMMEAERDKSRALEALQSLVGGQMALKEIVVQAKLENVKRYGQGGGVPGTRMSIDDYKPSYNGINLSTARTTARSQQSFS